MRQSRWLSWAAGPAASLRLARFFTALYALGSLVVVCNLLGRTADLLRNEQQLQLSLDVRTPNLLPELADARQGWEDGAAGRPSRNSREPKPAWRGQSQGYELAANPLAPVLRYPEPNGWKRMALLYAGALDDSYSLAELLYYALGGWLTWRLLRSLTPAQPFTPETARRLRHLGLLVAALVVWGQVAGWFVRLLVPAFQVSGAAEPLNHYVRLHTEGLPGLLPLLALSVISFVYGRGLALSREAELVI